MKYLKKYNESKLLCEENYSIYIWYEDLKRFLWTRDMDIPVNEKTLKKYSKQFIGDVWYEKIEKLVDRMFDSLRKVDTVDINYRMYDVYDNIPYAKEKSVFPAIVNGNYEDYEKENSNKFNGYITVPKDLNDKFKIRIIVTILQNIVQPTLTIGDYPSVNLRKTNAEKFVTDDKYKCENFDIDNYTIKENDEIQNTERFKPTIIRSFHIEKKKKYSIDKILEMYKPAIVINIGGYDSPHTTGKMNLKKLESDLDEVLLSILPDVDYKDVIFDCSRFTRRYSDNTNIYEYTLKILLNF